MFSTYIQIDCKEVVSVLNPERFLKNVIHVHCICTIHDFSLKLRHFQTMVFCNIKSPEKREELIRELDKLKTELAQLQVTKVMELPFSFVLVGSFWVRERLCGFVTFPTWLFCANFHNCGKRKCSKNCEISTTTTNSRCWWVSNVQTLTICTNTSYTFLQHLEFVWSF